MSEIVLVAIVGRNGVIGADGDQPWHFRCDLQRFKALTRGHPVIMGRRTLAAIGRPLPQRTNIVLTRDPGFHADGVEVATDPEAALARAAESAGGERVMILGGGDVYRLFLPRAHRLALTEVDDAPPGDTTFPAIGPEWQETAREEAEEDGYRLTFRTLLRTTDG
ncbi:dihydrofolate reductase [Halorhodospira halophila]|uniref:Dihydrofolate reductase n=1 Tax=Halorhodospira halophila (strain DSM 244 / SL1) TaxID=349124 RepID=A1WYQ0_HALHL|nr:dihydrofolate reductase [Halorhodospira halophila]ABM62812.1 dihydrofolate reductase [Halorhodospira halophila SL1]MBK1728065.1 dihydrofolate reductase [Halorhodospira halophila]